MGKYLVFLFFLFAICSGHGQIEGNTLLGLVNVTTAEMNAVTDPINGSLVYNTTENWVFQYNGDIWEKLSDSTSTPIVSAKTTDYTITAEDNGNILTFDSATDVTLTIVADSPVGFNTSVYQLGDGQVTIVGTGEATVKNRLTRFKTAGKDAGGGILCPAANIYHVTGDLKK